MISFERIHRLSDKLFVSRFFDIVFQVSAKNTWAPAERHLPIENIKGRFALIMQHFRSHKKNQNRCHQSRFTGSKYI